MLDMDTLIAKNILKELKRRGKKQSDLVQVLGYSKQVVSNMLSGARMINATELKQIAEYLNVSMEKLVEVPDIGFDNNPIYAFMGQTENDEGKKALVFFDKLINLYLFHSNIYESGTESMNRRSSL
ncbi:MAG: helix-turn-helix domain-containing protein [Erysipelotrichaceae bacterium]